LPHPAYTGGSSTSTLQSSAPSTPTNSHLALGGAFAAAAHTPFSSLSAGPFGHAAQPDMLKYDPHGASQHQQQPLMTFSHTYEPQQFHDFVTHAHPPSHFSAGTL
jgi:hypothetical protein